LPVPTSEQAEGLVFLNNRDFVISNEKGKLYRASFKEQ
jgi:hypothetical protein